jgi:hypothetical protein
MAIAYEWRGGVEHGVFQVLHVEASETRVFESDQVALTARSSPAHLAVDSSAAAAVSAERAARSSS